MKGISVVILVLAIGTNSGILPKNTSRGVKNFNFPNSSILDKAENFDNVESGGPAKIPNCFVTLSQRAENIQILFDQIKWQTGVQLKPSDLLKNEILAINVNQVPLQILMEKISKVEFSNWQQIGTSIYLEPNEQKMRAGSEAGFEKTARQVQESIEKRKREFPQFVLDQLKNSTTPYTGTFSNIPRTLIENTSLKYNLIKPDILEAIGAETFASIRRGHRVVFSTEPTPLQRPIFGNLKKLIEEEREIIKQIKHGSNPFKAILTIERGANEFNNQSYWCKLNFYEPNGSLIQCIGTSIPAIPGYDRNGVPDEWNEMPWKPKQKDPPNDIVLPEDSNYLFNPIENGNFKFTPRPTNLKDEIKSPTKTDPLAYPSDFLVAAAQLHELNLVAALPDTAFDQLQKPSFNSDKYLNFLDSQEQLTVSNENGWLLVASADPESTLKNRIDRKIVENFINENGNQKVNPMESLSKFALSCRGVMPFFLQSSFRIAFPPVSGFSFFEDWGMLAFYGSLTEFQRSQMSSGQGLNSQNLSHDSLSYLNRLIYGTDQQVFDDRVPIRLETGFNDPVTGLPMLMFDDGRPSRIGLNDEQTEFAKEGRINTSVIKGRLTDSNIYSIVRKMDSAQDDETDLMAPYNALQTGNTIAGEKVRQTIYFPKSHSIGIIPGKRKANTIRIYFAPNMYISETIFEDHFAPNAPVIGLLNLPQDVAESESLCEAAYLKKQEEDFRNTGVSATPDYKH